MLNVTANYLSAICGGGDFESTLELADVLVTRLDELVKAASSVLAAIACDNLVPLYTSTFYNGTCEYSIQGVTWTFAAFLVIAVFGMLMITFRTAYFPTEIVEEDKLGMTPMDYNEAYEVEYDPAKALPLEDGAEEKYGLEKSNVSNVVTGISVGAATGAAVAASGSSGRDDDVADDYSQQQASVQMDGSPQASVNQQSIQLGHPSSFDDANWLDDGSSPVASQY